MALGGIVGRGSGGGGAEVEEDVVVVEGEGGRSDSGCVVESKGLGEVAALGAHVEVVAEDALGRFAAGLLLGPGGDSGGGVRVRGGG